MVECFKQLIKTFQLDIIDKILLSIHQLIDHKWDTHIIYYIINKKLLQHKLIIEKYWDYLVNIDGYIPPAPDWRCFEEYLFKYFLLKKNITSIIILLNRLHSPLSIMKFIQNNYVLLDIESVRVLVALLSDKLSKAVSKGEIDEKFIPNHGLQLYILYKSHRWYRYYCAVNSDIVYKFW